MPAEGVDSIPHSEILSYEEIFEIVQAAAELGITKVRLTGGEPLVRGGLPVLIRMIAGIKSIEDIALTTNGILLSRFAAELKAAGLKRVNVSLDTLNPDKFIAVTRSSGTMDQVLAGIARAKEAGLDPVKINMVVMKGINDNEIVDFARKTVNEEWNVRYIELMPFTGNAEIDSRFMSVNEIKRVLEPLGELVPATMSAGNGPAKYFQLPGARGTIGFITPVTEHFCFNCNRLRLTSDGKLRPCLLSENEIDLKQPVRSGISHDGLKKLIVQAVESKPKQHRLAEGQANQTGRRRPMSHVGG